MDDERPEVSTIVAQTTIPAFLAGRQSMCAPSLFEGPFGTANPALSMGFPSQTRKKARLREFRSSYRINLPQVAQNLEPGAAALLQTRHLVIFSPQSVV